MGKRKITCSNKYCKHNLNKACDCCIEINKSGKCTSFEKDIVYYFGIVFDALDSKNYIDMVEILMNPDLKIGMYYVMECYGLGFSEMEWGTSGMFMLKDGESGAGLSRKEIKERELIMDKFSEHIKNFKNGILPNIMADSCEKDERQRETESKEFGWLSPLGEFTESPFGTHEESAQRICEEKGFIEEYRKWEKKATEKGVENLMRDFLSSQKGYCLIHNPSGYGGYLTTNLKPLTNKQKEFLYGYFMDMGDRFKAEQYIDG